MYTLLVFVHLLAASMALGAIVATDLRLLSKLSQDKVRIAPPNAFVARIVLVALVVLWLTGTVIVAWGMTTRPDYLANPKLQVKIGFVALLTLNALMLHRYTFPRLARGRRVPRWTLTDWLVVAIPVAASNFLWLSCAFLGIARAWNYTMPLRDILEIAASFYLVVQIGVFAVLATTGRRVEPDRLGWVDKLARSLATLGSLGTRADEQERADRRDARREAGRSRRHRSRRASPETSLPPDTVSQPLGASLPPALSAQRATRGDDQTTLQQPPGAPRPSLRLVDTQGAGRGGTERVSRRTR